ncbi:MAG: biotin synthase BioB, partial [Planctomycetota bacterium]|nr:biotin synthase BioB [Planctomycetota bacterium]
MDETLSKIADKALEGKPVSREEAMRLASPATDLNELLFHADRIRRRFKSNEVKACSIISARTGGCSEDCAFCAQSVRWKTGVKPTPICSAGDVAMAAKRTAKAGSYAFSIVASGPGIRSGKELDIWCELLEAVAEAGVERPASLGALDDAQIERLKASGLSCYCHNLETSERFFPRICTTHSYADRIETARRIKRHGVR